MLRGSDRASATRDWLGWSEPAADERAAADTPHGPVPKVFRERFAAAAGGFHLAERFDDLAARLYYDAEDPTILGDQEQAIRRLLARRRQMIGTPLVTSYEEQDPHFGKWTTTVLTFGEYGDFKLVNNSYVHLNNPPITIPPRVLDVHLCWGARFAGAPYASVLHGVTALVIDDWRHALQDVPVRFHLHRLGPVPHAVELGRGGRRWRHRDAGRLPPAKPIGALFARANRARAIQPFAMDDRREQTAKSWWCACLLERDLPSLGFRPGEGTSVDGHQNTWSASDCGLPRPIDHVIVVPPDEGDGVFHRVVSRDGLTVLDPIRRGREDVDVRWWQRLRVQALDLALDELLTRMD